MKPAERMTRLDLVRLLGMRVAVATMLCGLALIGVMLLVPGFPPRY